jgi:hypothetical protein
VIGGTVLALSGVVLVLARSSVSRLNELGTRKLAVRDRREKPLDYDRKNAAYAGTVLIIAGVAMVVVGCSPADC